MNVPHTAPNNVRTWEYSEGFAHYHESGRFSPFKFLKENGKMEQVNQGASWTVRGVTNGMGRSIECSVDFEYVNVVSGKCSAE